MAFCTAVFITPFHKEAFSRGVLTPPSRVNGRSTSTYKLNLAGDRLSQRFHRKLRQLTAKDLVGRRRPRRDKEDDNTTDFAYEGRSPSLATTGPVR